MTKRQVEVVRAILQCQFKGQVPSLKRLAKRLRFSCPKELTRYFRNLERLGILEREGNGSYTNETRTLRVIWPAKNLIRPPYRMMWSMVDGRLAYSPKDIGPFPLDHQKEVSGV